MEMKGQRQILRTTIANANVGRVWSILMDSRLLPQWTNVVREVESCEVSGESIGAARRCRVELGGRAGRMVERCVALEAERHIAYVVEDESFGMRKMFDHYGFRISLQPTDVSHTEITIETFYTPRNALYSVMNALMMRRQLRKVVDQLLSGLVDLSSGGATTAANVPSTAKA